MTAPPQEVTFRKLDDDQLRAGIEALAAALERDGWQPQFIVGVGRGGLVPGCFLSHRTGIPLLSVDLSSGVAEFGEALLRHIAGRTATGTRVLFVDDINDSGRTIAALRRIVAAHGGEAANVRVAVLIDNAVSSMRVDYAAQTIDRTTCKDWFVFPWEAVAPAETLNTDALAVPERLGTPPGLPD